LGLSQFPIPAKRRYTQPALLLFGNQVPPLRPGLLSTLIHAPSLPQPALVDKMGFRYRSQKNAQVLLDWLLTIEGTKWHYLHGVRDQSKISPDNWVIDQAYQDRPGNKEIQLSILYNAKRNLDVYADWQEYFRQQQPPMLITWGKNDGIFTVEGAELYKRDIPSAELHLFDTGHFALEEEVDRIGSLIHEFLDRTTTRNKIERALPRDLS
jgi:pimeloyl-ACP methyl ester carboxylesterase